MVTSEFCDNGEGTITISTSGEEDTQDLNGATLEEIIAAFEQIGANYD